MPIRPIQAALMLAVLVASAAPGTAAVRTYFSPELQGYRASSCLADGRTCGKPAADAWCRLNGWSSALIFQREPEPGVTRIVDSGDLCSGPACTSFRQIKCYTPETAGVEVLQSGG
jgi:hypothetical protein